MSYNSRPWALSTKIWGSQSSIINVLLIDVAREILSLFQFYFPNPGNESDTLSPWRYGLSVVVDGVKKDKGTASKELILYCRVQLKTFL